MKKKIQLIFYQDVLRLCFPNSDHIILGTLPMSSHPFGDLRPVVWKKKKNIVEFRARERVEKLSQGLKTFTSNSLLNASSTSWIFSTAMRVMQLYLYSLAPMMPSPSISIILKLASINAFIAYNQSQTEFKLNSTVKSSGNVTKWNKMWHINKAFTRWHRALVPLHYNCNYNWYQFSTIKPTFTTLDGWILWNFIKWSIGPIKVLVKSNGMENIFQHIWK